MTDVRLTATNPEDSSVVPVACNAKGELLIEEPTLAVEDFVSKTDTASQNIVSDLTLGADKITLDATDGSAYFADEVDVNALNYGGTAPGLPDDKGRLAKNGALIVDRSTGATDVVVGRYNGNITSQIRGDGSAEFAGNVDVGDYANSDSGFIAYAGGGLGIKNPNTAASAATVLNIDALDKEDVIKMSLDGSAEFAGNVEVGDFDNTTGTKAFASGSLQIRRNDSNTAIVVYKDGTTTGNQTAVVNADGSAVFAGFVEVGSPDFSNPGVGSAGVQLTTGGSCLVTRTVLDINANVFRADAAGIPVFTVKGDGKGDFAGDVVVGSRSKKWMLVEQGGLCHMVEQLRATPATEYPPLRDVIAELNVIEAALGEVMEKLRMTPPAGWEVWDGSDEIS